MFKDFKHIKNVADDNSTATMLLNKRIGNAYDEFGNCTEYGIQGDHFANEMLYLKACLNVENIEVEINSPGGDVTQHGYDIVNAIIKHKANTKVTGLAASMAGIAAMCGEKRSIVDYGSIMCHAVSGGVDEDSKVLTVIQDSLKTIVNNRTKMNGDVLDNLFKGEKWISNSKKADYTLQDAIDMGMVDEIISSGRKVKVSNHKDLASAVKFYNSINENQNKYNMVNLTKKLNLKNDLAEEKVEAAAIEAIETLETEKATLTSELEASKAKTADLEAKIKASEEAEEAKKTTEATLSVDNAIKAGKFKAEQKDEMIVLAKTNINAFNTLVGATKGSKEAVKITFGSELETTNSALDKKIAERQDWKQYDWMKKDSSGYENLLKFYPEHFTTKK